MNNLLLNSVFYIFIKFDKDASNFLKKINN